MSRDAHYRSRVAADAPAGRRAMNATAENKHASTKHQSPSLHRPPADDAQQKNLCAIIEETPSA